ncbi:hypothetical protein EXIGLDRAFT_719505 [Exidia glandulosa HHB12029]|uniref:P-loop containing nucleoside triphosphate hydrolase protein n=1 Tax=Exidia glandulosa HHB12029 TaxID=1314781 RepID=A0A165NRS1_EXIGL|nr:hypothetical protein EXIGLDRAFT_719505 [Exidia glandulosa HHB12029]
MSFASRLYHPPPAPPGFAQGKTVPASEAGLWSKIWIMWVFPLLKVGFSRPLQEDDLWQVEPSRKATLLGDNIEKTYGHRVRKRDAKQPLPAVDVEAAEKGGSDAVAPERDYTWTLIFSLYSCFKVPFWTTGVLKLVADVLTVTSPLVSQAILLYLTTAYTHARVPDAPAPKSVGYGIALAIILFLMQAVATMCDNHCTLQALSTGIAIRTSMSSFLFRKSLRLSNKSRILHSKGQITTMLSEDAPRLDRVIFFGHQLWLAPLQFVIAIALLIKLLGVSALVGVAVLILSIPIQNVLVGAFFKAIRKNLTVTDSRVKLLQEVLQGIRSIKMYAWENVYGHKIVELRQRELRLIRNSAIAMSLIQGTMTLVPILSCTLTFVTYSLTGHDLTPATIFSALQLFTILRMPMLMFPAAISILAQSFASLKRMAKFISAEEAPAPFPVKPEGDIAIDIDGDFAWEEDAAEESTAKPSDKGKKEKNRKSVGAKEKEKAKDAGESEEKAPESVPKAAPFALTDLRLQIQRGAFVAIVGRVGSGKTSLLQALAGEMRKTRGNVVLGGTVSYVPQSPWIVNASVKDNITFGEEDDSSRYQKVMRACSLQPDLDILQFGDRTEIGEKGINLSGGQRARVSLARAAYSSADIILLDDPISALDAHVGKAILDNCLVNGPLADRTRVLVTHALHMLPHVDRVYVLDRGRIVEEGHYKELLAQGGAFARLVEEFGSSDSEAALQKPKTAAVESEGGDKSKDQAPALMQEEDRATGSVDFAVYKKYFDAAGGSLAWIPSLLILLTITQAAQVASTLFLGFWTSRTIPGLANGHYIAIYSSLGIAQSFFQIITSFCWAIVGLKASYFLFANALSHVMGSPVSFFDTTPMGRIVSRLTKDVSVLDTQMWQLFDSLFQVASSIFGTIALVFYTFPYLGILFAPLFALYYVFLTFYRRNSVEVKRLESVLRSSLYSSYIETMNGISTVRATRQEPRFIHKTELAIDDQNRAAFLQYSIMVWLGLRINVFGNFLILGIGLLAVGERTDISPAKVGVVLSYTLSITQFLSEIVTSFAAVEQAMNGAERMITYGELPAEGSTIPDQKPPPPSWPSEGGITFKNVTMAYREGLPDVLHGISFSVKPGEKVGIVGRTGAGKSTLSQALLRLVEIRNGAIEIDGVNIQSIDLPSLRAGVAIIPQDSLFLGNLRENIDPLRTRTDAELLGILQKSHLLPGPGQSDPAAEARFTLDASLGQEGVGLSAGEKQQLALCRVLVKQSRIIILDEATSSVDVELDAKLQHTIRTELASSTLLCVAHRLNTIAHYDRVLVMDRGVAAEFDTPLVLFDQEHSIFRSLCDEAGLTRDDIVRIRTVAHGPGRDLD